MVQCKLDKAYMSTNHVRLRHTAVTIQISTTCEVKIDTAESCYTCQGTGKVNPTILLTDDIIRDLEYIEQSRPKTSLRLEVHPYIYAFMKQGFPNFQWKRWFKKQRWLRISANSDFALNEYKFFDKNKDEIRLY